MLQKQTIQPFNPFSLQHGTNDSWPQDVLQSIAYGDSRLRTALGKMIKAEGWHQGWMQACLLKETRFFLEYIGITTAMGLVFDTPIVLRSLAVFLHNASPSHLPLAYDPRLTSILSAGTRSEHAHRTVSQYKYDWWNNTSALATLDNQKFHVALNFHRNQLNYQYHTTAPPDDNGSRFCPPSPTPPPVPRIDVLNVPKIAVPNPGAAPDCAMCDTYQQMAANLYQMNVDALRYNRQLLLLAETDSSLCERRIAGFYEVHKATIIKETTQVPTAGTESGPGLALLPPHRSHWTWGEALTQADVLALGRSQQTDIHTGYGMELDDGNIMGNDSETRNTVGSAALDNMSDDSEVEIVPPQSLSWGGSWFRNMLANMSKDDEVEIMSVLPTTHIRPTTGNISDDDEVQIISSTNICSTALANMFNDSVIEIVENPAPSNEGSQSWAQSPSAFRIQAVLDNMLSDDDKAHLPAASSYSGTILNIPAAIPDFSPAQILAALNNMSSDDNYHPPSPVITALSPLSSHIRLQTALDNMSSDDDEAHPPARSDTGTILNIPAAIPDFSLARILAALNNMSDDDGLPPHPPSPVNDAAPTQDVLMLSNDDHNPVYHNPYPYSLPPDSSDGQDSSWARKKVKQTKRVYRPEDFEDMDDSWFE